MSLTVVIGAAMSSFAIGWGFGRMLKAIRQFFDSI